MTHMTISDFTTRNLNSIAEAERQLRANAEDIARRYRKLLIELATRMAGQALQDIQRDDPGALDRWQPRDWEKFWALNMPVTGSGWGAAPAARTTANDREMERVKRESEGLLQSLTELRQRVMELERENKSINDQLYQQEKQLAGKASQKAVEKKPAGPVSPVYAEVMERLTKIELPKIPERFSKRIGVEAGASDLRFKRQMQVMWLIAECGYSSRLEIDRLVGLCEGVQMGSGSIRKAAQELEKTEMILPKTLEMTTPFTTRLSVYRLSADGADFWRNIGRTPVLSEWQKLLAGKEAESNPQHALAVLAFCMHARMRGWNAQILPAVDGPARPDVRVTRNNETLLVQVMEQGGTPEMWKNLAEAGGGTLAFCAMDEAGRNRLKNEVSTLGLKGVATDLNGLIFLNGSPRQVDEIQPDEPLWSSRW